MWLDNLKSGAFYTISFHFLIIIFIIHYISKLTRWISWWKGVVASNGTWVRIPGPPYFSMFFIFTCSGDHHTQGSTIQLHPLACHAPRDSIQRPRCADHHTHWSTAPYTSLKNQRRPDCSAPNCFPKPPNWVNTPHVCISFSHSFFFFYLFVLI